MMTTDKPRIFQDIEATAGFYGPARYLGLLSHYQDLDASLDPLSVEFIPLTAAKTTDPKASKLFAIGIIPPSANVTGQTLDRSASVAAEVGFASATDDASVSNVPVYNEGVAGGENKGEGTEGQVAKSGGGPKAALHRWARGLISQALKEVLGREPTLNEIQYCQAIGWFEGNYGKSSPGKNKTIQNNWGGVQCRSPGVGNCLLSNDKLSDGRSYPVGFLSYEKPYDGCLDMIKHIVHRGAIRALNASGTYFGTSLVMRRGSYYGGFCYKAAAKHGSRKTAMVSLTAPYRDEATKECDQEAIDGHAKLCYNLVTKQIGPANKDPSTLPLGDFDSADTWFRNSDLQCGPIQQQEDPVCKAKKAGQTIEGDAGTGDWRNGRKDAKKAAEEVGLTADTPLNQTELGKKFQAAQKQQIVATQIALENMRNTPPLRLLVNPRQFSVKGTKIVQDGNWSRNGPIIEHWGGEQDTISASGRLAGFYAIDVTNASGVPGLTRYARNFSQSWANFLSLYLLYKNNGGVYLRDPIASSSEGLNAMNLSLVGSIYIYYDNILYIGSFNSFNITEEENTPFTIEYSFDFTVRAAFLLDRPDAEYDMSYAYTIPIKKPEAAPGASKKAGEKRLESLEDYFAQLRSSG